MKKYILEIVLVLSIIFINIFFLAPVFQPGLTAYPGSIESVFLAEANFVKSNFPNIFWYPFWYFGLPFYLTYQPVPIFLSALVPYRILTGIFLILGAVGAYFWAKYLTRSKIAAFVAALAYSLLPSVSYLFLGPGWSNWQTPLRLVNTFVYGEGPHIWGLGVIPFACLFWQKLLKHPEKRINWVVTVLTVAIILLTSLTAFVGLLPFFLFIFFWEITRKTKRKIITSFLVLIFVIALGFFWYNPDFIKAIFDYSLGDGGGVFTGAWATPIFSIAVLFTFFAILYFAFGTARRYLAKNKARLTLIITFFVFLFILVYGWFTWNAAVFPLPFRTIPRLIPELELACGLFIGGMVALFTQKRFGWVIGLVVAAGIVLFAARSLKDYRSLVAPHRNFPATSEMTVAGKLEELGAKRVYLTGTHAFWLNTFNQDTTQLRGGKGGDFGGLNPWWAHLTYFLNKSEDRDLTFKWLGDLGLEYIVVNYPGPSIYYHDFDNLQRFESLTEVFSYREDKIFKLPTKNTGLVLELPRGWSAGFTKPTDLSSGKIVLNKETAEKYSSFVEDTAKALPAVYPFDNWSKLKIPAGSRDGEILIRQSYFPGWKATSGGKKLKLVPDPLGFTLIKDPGPGEIILQFTPPVSVMVSCLVSLVGLSLFILFLSKNLPAKIK